jgi:hypothetical protein
MRKLVKSIGRGIGKANKDGGARRLDNDGIRAILANVDNDDRALCAGKLKRSERYSL